MRKDGPLSNKQYISHKGTVCPACESENVAYGEIESSEHNLIQRANCLTCDANWLDVFALKGYEDLVIRTTS